MLQTPAFHIDSYRFILWLIWANVQIFVVIFEGDWREGTILPTKVFFDWLQPVTNWSLEILIRKDFTALAFSFFFYFRDLSPRQHMPWLTFFLITINRPRIALDGEPALIHLSQSSPRGSMYHCLCSRSPRGAPAWSRGAARELMNVCVTALIAHYITAASWLEIHGHRDGREVNAYCLLGFLSFFFFSVSGCADEIHLRGATF